MESSTRSSLFRCRLRSGLHSSATIVRMDVLTINSRSQWYDSPRGIICAATHVHCRCVFSGNHGNLSWSRSALILCTRRGMRCCTRERATHFLSQGQQRPVKWIVVRVAQATNGSRGVSFGCRIRSRAQGVSKASSGMLVRYLQYVCLAGVRKVVRWISLLFTRWSGTKWTTAVHEFFKGAMLVGDISYEWNHPTRAGPEIIRNLSMAPWQRDKTISFDSVPAMTLAPCALDCLSEHSPAPVRNVQLPCSVFAPGKVQGCGKGRVGRTDLQRSSLRLFLR